MNCKQCRDVIVVEGEGCAKCGNQFCGYCCEWGNEPFCGDHIQPITECGCLL
jgi:hypothetical protein